MKISPAILEEMKWMFSQYDTNPVIYIYTVSIYTVIKINMYVNSLLVSVRCGSLYLYKDRKRQLKKI